MSQKLNPRLIATPAEAPEDWRILFLLALYRLVLVTALLSLYQTGYGSQLFDDQRSIYFYRTCVGYAVVALLILLPLIYRRPSIRFQSHIHFGLDAFAVTALVWTAGGVTSGFGVLMMLPALGCGLLLSPRMAVLQAAAATLLIFCEELIRQSAIGFETSEFTQTGLLGLMLFGTSFTASQVALRARRSEQIAEKVGSEFADLSRLSESIIQSMQSGVLVVDAAGVIRTHNRAAGLLLAHRAPLGRPLAAVSPALHTLLSQWLQQPDADLRLTPTPDSRELLPRFTRLGYKPTSPILIVLEDGARLREQAQQMKLAALGRMSASIAHEIRNPLAAITHAGELLAESPDLRGGQDQRLLGMIQRHGSRINKIIQDVLSLSKPDRIDRQRLDLREWIIKTLTLYQEGYPQTPRPIEIGAVPNDLRIVFDPNHLQQVLFNLWDNSFDHGAQGTERPTVIMAAGALEGRDQVFLEVQDDGPGIPVELHDKIFEPFFTTTAKGTGLGLFLCRELCEYNHARLLHLASRPGACFRIAFPTEYS